MARTIETIKNEILESIESTTGLEGLTSTSQTSIFRALAYVMAVVAYSLEVIFDAHKEEVNNTIAEQKPHTLKWYRNKALAFRYGYALGKTNEYSLAEDSDVYPNDVIENEDAAIISYAACVKKGNVLQIKVAKESNGLAALLAEEKAALEEYFTRVQDAGVTIKIVSQEADHLRLYLDIYYDPLVLDDNGMVIAETRDDYGTYPLPEAIKTYLQNLPFNGEFSLTALTDVLQKIDGVTLPRVTSAQSYWGTPDWEDIKNKYIPEAGWLKIYDMENELNPTWHADTSK